MDLVLWTFVKLWKKMITYKQLAAVIGIFGLVVIGSGLIRYLTDSAGQNGLYFGLFAGGIALIGAALSAANLTLLGRIVAALAVALVLLWFSYDMYNDLKRNFVIGGAEVRKTIVLASGLLAAIAIGLPQRK
jgi:hypothetical protein